MKGIWPPITGATRQASTSTCNLTLARRLRLCKSINADAGVPRLNERAIEGLGRSWCEVANAQN